MAKYLNERLWKKAYLLEFKMNNVVTDAFTFSVPPQSEEFSFPQRIAETKTFGGAVIDDYGNDTINITLSGTTINQEVKLIYRSVKGMKFLDGEQEIFYLQKMIKKFGKKENLKGKKIYLYELKSGTKSFSNKWWEVKIKDFQIRRSKDAPMTYNYTISFIANPEVQRLSLGLLDNLLSTIKDGIEKIKSAAEILQKGLTAFESITNLIKEMNELVTEFEEQFTSLTGVISGYIDEASNTINETISLGDNIVSSAQRIVLNSGLSALDAAKNLNTSVKSVGTAVTTLCESVQSGETPISAELLERYNKTASEIADVWFTQSDDLTTNADKIYANICSLNNSYEVCVMPGTDENGDQAIISYGHIERNATNSDTWDSLSKEYYNNADYGALIASYNGMTKELEAGDKISIPILSQTDITNQNNDICNANGERDNYGKDILLEDKDLATHNGDFETDGGIENLNQAVTTRLSTELNSRIRQETYGIRANIGDADAASTFVLASIEQTLSQEPRIKSIDDMTYTGIGGNINVEVNYTDINDQSQTFGGTIS